MWASSPKERFGAAHLRATRLNSRTWTERVAYIEQTRGLANLEPKIAREAFVGPFAGQHHLVTLRTHFAR